MSNFNRKAFESPEAREAFEHAARESAALIVALAVLGGVAAIIVAIYHALAR